MIVLGGFSVLMAIAGGIVVSSPMWADVPDDELVGTLAGGVVLMACAAWSFIRLMRRKDEKPLARVGPVWILGAALGGIPIALSSESLFTKIWTFALCVVVGVLAVIALLGDRGSRAGDPANPEAPDSSVV
jgi:uncharacterized membrane protein YfcA